MTARRRGVRGFDGSALRATRELRHMTAEELGRSVGIQASLISAYEEGRRIPEWRTLAALATALTTHVDQLRPGHATTMEDLRCAAGQGQDAAGLTAGLGRSGYAMLENGHTRTLKPDVAEKLARAWGVEVNEVCQAHAAAVQAAGAPAPVLEGAVLAGLAAHFGITPVALLGIARGLQDQTERRSS
ncbi:helix-turn-helix domain-containing protein [Streptomyces sp. NBC_01221]|uniref:helix-turn-helix domain-containing protein n=1 Tax=Streptomyces sp. NBC_01221 TaxID=2903782 RepID=UPI0022522DC2|nr:helix-turn-helix transcriptional regulator [Streptomyces sp. NBC_01221]MCX4792026.1 helix-turn-helix domain-containing protein [Streptomyces sp. NBC_01221]MCX4792566.1 helix-turn-helix domain-containing protein [Streptomyces sp. NBC_01221]